MCLSFCPCRQFLAGRQHPGPPPPGQTPPAGRHTPWQADTPPHPGTATAADGTHPTEMHSCFLLLLHKWSSFLSSWPLVLCGGNGSTFRTMWNAVSAPLTSWHVLQPWICNKLLSRSEVCIIYLGYWKISVDNNNKIKISRSERIPHAGSYWLLL